jgi:hypothetical protein
VKAELTLIPTCIVNPSTIVIYNQVHWDPIKASLKKEKIFVGYDEAGNSKFLESSRKAEGNVSTQAKRKLNKAIEYLIATSTEKKVYERLSGKTVKFKVAFITLTLPSEQVHPDTEIINRCLNSFLLECKKFYLVKNYVWRAEKQKNGNLHFHVVLDKFIPWNELRNRWNRIINKLGYVDRYQENQKEWHKNGFRVREDKLKFWNAQDQYNSYLKSAKTGFQSPNSTDIHSTKKIRNIKQYLSKYMTKNEYDDIKIVKKYENDQNSLTTEELQHFDKISDLKKKEYLSLSADEISKLKQSGRIWGCNHDLSGIRGFSSEIDSELSEDLTKITQDKTVRRHIDTYYSVYYINYHDLQKIGADHLFKYFAAYLFDKFQYSEQLKISA